MKDALEILAAYYDDEYGLKSDDIDFYLQHALNVDRLLEIGIGTGRIAIPLAQQGVTVYGIDSSIPMLKRLLEKCSRQAPISVHCCCADMRTMCLNMTFPLILMPFRVFLHNLSQFDQIQTLKKLYQHLEDDGILLFDVVVPLYPLLSGSVWQDEFSETRAEGNDKLTIRTKINHDPVKQHFHIHNDYKVGNENQIRTGNYSYRYVFRYEMEALLKLCGFCVEQIYGGFDARPYDYHSGLMVFKARKASQGCSGATATSHIR
jgi:SAM-dependent methyltransferase